MWWTRIGLAALIVHANAFDLASAGQHEDPFGHHTPVIVRRVDEVSPGYIAPSTFEGSMDFGFEGEPDTRREPINIIVSGKSSFGSLQGPSTEAIFNTTRGFSQYLSALNISDECLGLHLSTAAFATISASGPTMLDFLYRENFGDYPSGTCKETLVGGYHYRGWRQPESQAWFLAGSLEQNLTLQHTIAPDGYDAGRNEFVRRAKLGGTDYDGCIWPPATLSNITDLVKADAGGPTGLYNHDIGIDGIVALITVGNPVCTNTTRPPVVKSWDVPSTTASVSGSSSVDSLQTSKISSSGSAAAGVAGQKVSPSSAGSAYDKSAVIAFSIAVAAIIGIFIIH